MSQDFLGNGQQGPDVKRLLLAGALMTVVLMGYNLLFPPKPVTPVAKDEAKAVAVAQPAPVAPLPLAAELPAGVVVTSNSIPVVTREFNVNVKASGEEATLAARGGYKAIVTSLGAQVSDFILTGYHNPIHLVGDESASHLFAIKSRDAQMTLPADAHYELVSSDENSVAFKHMTPEGIQVIRRYQFAPNQFVMNQEIELRNDANVKRQISLDILLDKGEPVSEHKSGGFLSPGADHMSAVWILDADHGRLAFDKLEKEQKSLDGQLTYIGVDTRYFLTALIPSENTSLKSSATAWEKTIGESKLKGLSWVLQQKPVELAPGGTYKWSYAAYMGPKQLGLLKQAGHQLDENVDFGWFSVIARPMLWLLGQIFIFVGNFGIAIILLTLLIKLLTFPLTQKSFVSMQQMKTLAPEMAALKKKYGHDRTALGQKQMELYKEKGINPMAGCLPMLIQMPIWFALYQMLWNSIELYQQPFVLWIHDLTSPDPYYVLPILMGASMFIQQAFQPTMEDQPQMKYVMWFMPLFLTFVMLNLPSGLSLYIFTNNILTILQQLYIRRRYGTT